LWLVSRQNKNAATASATQRSLAMLENNVRWLSWIPSHWRSAQKAEGVAGEPAYRPRNIARIPLAPGIRRVSPGKLIRPWAWQAGINLLCHEEWRHPRTPPRSASRPARGTAVPLLVAVYRGAESDSGCAGFEDRGRLTDETTVRSPRPASMEAMLSWTFTLSRTTRTPRSTTVSKFSSVMGTSDGRCWGAGPSLARTSVVKRGNWMEK
jgi:hypothetical protein